MKQILYEWSYEIEDENGDITDNDFAERLSDFHQHTGNLVLVRDEGTEHKLTDRYWAYVNDNKLPEYFADALGNSVDIKVPQKFHEELQKHFS